MRVKTLITVGVGISMIVFNTSISLAQTATKKIDDNKVQKLEQDLLKMHEELDSLKKEVKSSPAKSTESPVQLKGSITVRYDNTSVDDATDARLDELRDGYRTRTRLGAEFSPEGANGPLLAGVRMSTGENNNPTSPFIRFGNLTRSESFNIDQFWISTRPILLIDPELKHDSCPADVILTGGRMPQPFWRGDWGTWRSEMVWDNDISPQGVTAKVLVPDLADDVNIQATAGYFVIQEVDDLRFSGFTGDTVLAAGQLKAEYEPIGALASTFYVFNNLNAGLRSPNFNPLTGGVSVSPGQSAILLRDPALQHTNNQVTYGPNALGFVEDRFTVFDLTGQLHYDLPYLDMLQSPRVYLAANYINNLSVDLDKKGYGLTVGVNGGKHESMVHPFNLWLTYRDVDNDATLATIADSDLGAGTGYRGVQIGGNYRLRKYLMLQITGYDFSGYPFKDNLWSRLFVDLIADF